MVLDPWPGGLLHHWGPSRTIARLMEVQTRQGLAENHHISRGNHRSKKKKNSFEMHAVELQETVFFLFGVTCLNWFQLVLTSLTYIVETKVSLYTSSMGDKAIICRCRCTLVASLSPGKNEWLEDGLPFGL